MKILENIDPKMFEFVNKNTKISRHKFAVSYNDPEEDPNINFKINIFGENTRRLVEMGNQFKDSLKEEYKPLDTPDTTHFNAYFELHISMKSIDKEKFEKVVFP